MATIAKINEIKIRSTMRSIAFSGVLMKNLITLDKKNPIPIVRYDLNVTKPIMPIKTEIFAANK